MKLLIRSLTLTITSLFLVACNPNSSDQSQVHSTTTTQTTKKDNQQGHSETELEQSKELSSTTFLINEVDESVAKTIERYVTLTSDYDFEQFNEAEAQKRLDDIIRLKSDGQLAEDEKTMFQPLLEVLETSERSPGGSRLVRLGIFKDETIEPDTAGLYDAAYQVASVVATEESGKVVHETTLVGMIFTMGDKIQSSISIADLNEVVDFEEFFNQVNE